MAWPSPGSIVTRQAAGRIRVLLLPDREFSFLDGASGFLRNAATVPRSSCVLDTIKTETAGIALRPIGGVIDNVVRG
jgi:hypothetical protein